MRKGVTISEFLIMAVIAAIITTAVVSAIRNASQQKRVRGLYVGAPVTVINGDKGVIIKQLDMSEYSDEKYIRWQVRLRFEDREGHVQYQEAVFFSLELVSAERSQNVEAIQTD